MRQKFNERFSIISMSKSSLLVLDNKTKKEAYIHRNVFNNIDKAEDIRVTDKKLSSGKIIPWVEILIWKTI